MNIQDYEIEMLQNILLAMDLFEKTLDAFDARLTAIEKQLQITQDDMF